MTPTQNPTQIEWYTKQEAGVRLGSIQQPMSTRRVLELAKEGKFQSDRYLDQKTGQMTIRIHAGSLERYLDERGARPERVPGMTAPPDPWTAGDALTKRLGELVELANLLRNGPPHQIQDGENQGKTPARLWLTLDESADYSGLPAGMLMTFIRQGKLRALDVGIRRGGRWRVRRMDLDLIEGNLLMLPEA